MFISVFSKIEKLGEKFEFQTIREGYGKNTIQLKFMKPTKVIRLEKSKFSDDDLRILDETFRKSLFDYIVRKQLHNVDYDIKENSDSINLFLYHPKY